jgi:Kef-type K+ transport system membrane component KefB
MLKNIAFYVFINGLFVGGVLLILHLGADLPPGKAEPVTRSDPSAADTHQPGPAGTADSAYRVLLDHLRHPLALLLMQLIVIVGAARFVGWLFRRIGQPSVIGEMVAGVLLGPSLLGMVWPQTQSFLFPASSMPALYLLSQVGVILYMFLVGIDLDLGHLRQKAHAAVLVSHASIVVPFFLGASLALFIYPAVAPRNISFTPFALFLGIAMSITAFPVLARIVEERGLTGSYLGSTTIACAAVDDVTAWCLLALVVAIAGASSFGAVGLTLVLTVCFIALMLLVVRPQAARFVGREHRSETGSKGLVAGVLTFAFAAALFTEVIGIHALFGAFLAGAVMPANARLRSFLRDRLETFTTVLLLPLFFAFTGLRTQIGLLADPESWLLCLVVIVAAVAGKFGGSTLAARWTGLGWKDSVAIGLLMNTRGLMELIVLNIGYDMGILSPRIFAMMVLMALVTTFMAGPLLLLLRVEGQDSEGIDNQKVAHASAQA